MSSRFDSRLTKARALADAGQITRLADGSGWLVPSQNSDAVYRVTLGPDGEPQCTCEDHARHGAGCKHALSVAIVAQREAKAAQESAA